MQPEPRREAFAEKTYHCRYDPIRTIRTERLQYIRNWKTDELLELGCDRLLLDSGKDLRDGCPDRPPPEELFDLSADPYELENLAGKPAYQSTVEEPRARLIWAERPQFRLIPLEKYQKIGPVRLGAGEPRGELWELVRLDPVLLVVTLAVDLVDLGHPRDSR